MARKSHHKSQAKCCVETAIFQTLRHTFPCIVFIKTFLKTSTTVQQRTVAFYSSKIEASNPFLGKFTKHTKEALVLNDFDKGTIEGANKFCLSLENN